MFADDFKMAMNDQPLSKEGFELMGAAFSVHNELGGGLLEEIYHEAFEFELEQCQIPFNSKAPLNVSYKGRELRKRYIPDLVVHDCIIVELKALSSLAPEHEGQILNYMRISEMPVGYLINFGPIEAVEWKRFVLTKNTPFSS